MAWQRGATPPVSKSKLSSSLCARCASESVFTRAAASSIASGMPSRRRHSVPVPPHSDSSKQNLGGSTWRARQTDVPPQTGSPARRSSNLRGGRLSDGTRQAHSPATFRASRLVAMMCSRGQLSSSAWTNSAPARMTCSQLSNTSSTCREPTASTRQSTTGRPACSWTSSAAATAAGTRSGESTASSRTSHTPSAYLWNASAATRRASRVLTNTTGTGAG